MKFICLTLFPEMIENGLGTSVIGKAIKQGILQLNTLNIRDYTEDKHGSVDDYTYGGGAGMLMKAQPVYDAYRAAVGERKVRTIYVTPQGTPFTQKMARELSGEEELIFLCGHYEGIDERVLEEVVTDFISIGDYVLTGGEMAAMVMIDAIARLVPGVLGNETSADIESFHNDLLEYPQYSRPEIWHGKTVPPVLLSGNHAEIEKWRLETSVEKTRRIRPDLYEKYARKQMVIQRLWKRKRNHIHIIESLRRGLAEVLYDDGNNIVLYQDHSGICIIDTDTSDTFLEKQKEHPRSNTRGQKKMDVFAIIPANTSKIISNIEENEGNMSENLSAFLEKKSEKVQENRFFLACYTQNRPLKIKWKDIREEKGGFSLYLEGVKCGQIRENPDGSIGLWDIRFAGYGSNSNSNSEILTAETEEHIKTSLLAYMVNRHRTLGYIPYLYVEAKDDEMKKLLEKAGFLLSAGTVTVVSR